jgi:hypothetical protein
MSIKNACGILLAMVVLECALHVDWQALYHRTKTGMFTAAFIEKKEKLAAVYLISGDNHVAFKKE